MCFTQSSARMAARLLLTFFAWLLLSASSTAEFGLVFVLTLENVFFLEISF